MSIPTPSRGRLKRLAALAAGLTATALVLAGCSSSTGTNPTATGTPVSGGTLTLARTASVTALDPFTEITANNAFAIDKVFEPLLTFDSTGKIIPAVASSYDESSDGLTWTFTIRKGIEFSNGTAVTPADVVWSLQEHLDTKDSPLPLSAPITSITASGTDKVVVKLKNAYTPFAAQLAGFSNAILPKNYAGETAATFFKKPIGTGPFVVDTWDPSGDISFTKNTHYWQPGKPYIDKLVYKLVPDDNQLIAQLTGGQVNAIDEVPLANVADLKANSAVSVASVDSWNVEELFFNNLDQHFKDRNVRRAVAYAIDRDGIAKATTFGTAKAAGSLLPPTIEYYAKDIDTLQYDVTKAKAELAKSAFPNGFTTTLLLASGDSQKAQEAQAIQDELGKIGITVKIKSIDLDAFRSQFKAFNYSFMLNSATSDTPDPDSIVSFQADPDAGTNAYWTHYADSKVTALLKTGQTQPAGSERQATYTQIQELIAQDAPYVPLSYPAAIKATSSTVHGLAVLPNGSADLSGVWISK